MTFRFIDQQGRDVPVTVKQDGHAPTRVVPGRRTRFKVRFDALAIRINRIAIEPDPKDWLINDLRIGGKSQWPSSGFSAAQDSNGRTTTRSIHEEDTPEQDGIDGDFLCAEGPGIGPNDRFDTAQTAMDIIFDVVYRGAHPEGEPFACTIHCMAVY